MRKSRGLNHAETWQERLAQAVQGFGLQRTRQHLGKVHELQTWCRMVLASQCHPHQLASRAGGPWLRAERKGFLIRPAALTGF